MKSAEYYLRLEKAIAFVEENLNTKISLSSISKQAFSSLSHFHRIFYFMTGVTLKEYIRRRRLSNAGIALITTSKSIIDIAHEVQFETPESFNKAFKKMFELSPRYCCHILPAAEYARFSVEEDPSQFEAAWRYIYGTWMPNSGRSRQKGLDFEIYFPNKTDIYIPMQPNTE